MRTTTLTRRSLALPILVCAMLGIAGCSGGITGSATSSTTSSGAPSSVPANPLASLDPCGLLSEEQLAQLGITLTGPDNTAKSRGCGWQQHGNYSVGIYLDGSQGIEAAGAPARGAAAVGRDRPAYQGFAGHAPARGIAA